MNRFFTFVCAVLVCFVSFTCKNTTSPTEKTPVKINDLYITDMVDGWAEFKDSYIKFVNREQLELIIDGGVMVYVENGLKEGFCYKMKRKQHDRADNILYIFVEDFSNITNATKIFKAVTEFEMGGVDTLKINDFPLSAAMAHYNAVGADFKSYAKFDKFYFEITYQNCPPNQVDEAKSIVNKMLKAFKLKIEE